MIMKVMFFARLRFQLRRGIGVKSAVDCYSVI